MSGGTNMADSKRYQVVIACVVVPVKGVDGATTLQTLYRGATFEGDPDNYRVAHNLESGYIAELGKDAAAGMDAHGTPLVDDKPVVGDGEAGDPVVTNDPGVVNEQTPQNGRVSEVEGDGAQARRRPGRPSNADKAARDKANAEKSGDRSGDEHSRLVDDAVKAGMDRGEAEKASVADLKAALNKQ